MLVEAKAGERVLDVEIDDLTRSLAGIDGQQDRDQALDDVGVAVGQEGAGGII